MKRILALIVVALFSSTLVYADYDPLDDPKSPQYKAAAKKRAEQRAIADKKDQAVRAEMVKQQEAKNLQREADSNRKKLGAEATGKSDAEVKVIIDAKDAAKEKQRADRRRVALGADANGKTDAEVKTITETKDRAAANEQMKAMTGKSLDEMEKMSPKEREAFEKEMSKKFGK
jgi:hypothetical protein